MSYSLIAIDMQPYFAAANDRNLLTACRKEIRKAIKNRASIIFVEYQDCGPTHSSLLRLSEGYDRLYSTTKWHDDGSNQVYDVICKNNLSSKRLKVIGVNTDCCVLATVGGLAWRLKSASIDVIAAACGSDYNHLSGLHSLSIIDGVKITR